MIQVVCLIHWYTGVQCKVAGILEFLPLGAAHQPRRPRATGDASIPLRPREAAKWTAGDPRGTEAADIRG